MDPNTLGGRLPSSDPATRLKAVTEADERQRSASAAANYPVADPQKKDEGMVKPFLSRMWRYMGQKRRLVDDDESVLMLKSQQEVEQVKDYKSEPERREIMKSWTIDTEDGDRRMCLNAVKRPPGEGRRSNTHLEWIHLEESVKTHARFKHIFLDHGSKDDVEGIDRIAKGLLRRIQKAEEKHCLNENYYLNACVGRYDGRPHDKSQEIRPCTFFNFPYFSLQQYTPNEAKSKTQDISGHQYPIRTLLQTRYRLESTEDRDKAQSILKLSQEAINTCIEPETAFLQKGKREDSHKILHVPQIWGLSKLMTSAPMSTQNLSGSIMKVNDISNTDAQELSMVEVFHEGKSNDPHRYPIGLCDWYFGLLDKQRQILARDQVGAQDFDYYRIFAKVPQKGDTKIDVGNWVAFLKGYRKSHPVLQLKLVKVAEPKPHPQRLQNAESQKPREDDAATEGGTPELNVLPPSPQVPPQTGEAPSETETIPPPQRNQGTNTSLIEPDQRDGKRIPFFQWPLRAHWRHELERKRLKRLNFVLSKHVVDFIKDYVPTSDAAKRTRNDSVAPSQVAQNAATGVKTIQGCTLAQYAEDFGRLQAQLEMQKSMREDSQPEDLRDRQIDRLIRDSETIVGSFLGGVVITGRNKNDRGGMKGAISRNFSQKLLQSTSELSALFPDTPEPPGIEDHKKIMKYRGILLFIFRQLMAQKPLSEDEFRHICDRFQDIMGIIHTLHMGVYSLPQETQQPVSQIAGPDEESDEDSDEEIDDDIDHDPDHDGIRIQQKSLVEAFEHIMYLHLGFCSYIRERCALQDPSEMPPIVNYINKHYEDCCAALRRAESDLIAEAAVSGDARGLGPVVNAEAMIILLLKRLSDGVHNHGSLDVIDLYAKIVEKFGPKVAFNASRTLLLELNKITEELEIVADVLKQQKKVLTLFRESMDPDTFRKPMNWKENFENQRESIDTIIKSTDDRIKDCDDLQNRVARLAKQDVQLVETEKDSNDLAILMFAAATIVFLPLTFMSGYFGMNLKGLAMEYRQSHFWTITAPFTAVISVPLLLIAFWYRLNRLVASLWDKWNDWSNSDNGNQLKTKQA